MLLKANHVIPGDGKTVIEHGAVLIERDKIRAVGEAATLEAGYRGPVQDFGEASILPGLIDAHVHLGNCQTQLDLSSYTIELKMLMAAHELQRAFSLGITGVRDVGSDHMLCETLRIADKKRFVRIPQLFTCDQGICMSGGHGWPLPSVRQADSPWEIRRAVRELLRDGADWIKVLTSHRTETPEYTQEELNAAVDECHRVGRKICVHAGAQPSIGMCIEAGFDTIEHGTFLTVEQAKRMAENGQAWVPTIIAYAYIDEVYRKEAATMGIDHARICPEQIEELLHELRGTRPELDLSRFSMEYVLNVSYFRKATETYACRLKPLADTGVAMLAGTDMVLDGAPLMPVARELEYMVAFGLDPLRAIQTATQTAAKVIGFTRTGTLEEGMFANLAVFTGNAAEDIRALSLCEATYFVGQRVY